MLETAQTVSDIGVAKASASFRRLFILGILAGVYIAFASNASTMAAFNLWADPATAGLGRCLAGIIFPGGLIMIVLAGGELFFFGFFAFHHRISPPASYAENPQTNDVYNRRQCIGQNG